MSNVITVALCLLAVGVMAGGVVWLIVFLFKKLMGWK